MGSPNSGAPGSPKPGQGRYLPPGRGKPKGVRNTVGHQVKLKILEVFEGLGGIEAMIRWAKKNRTDFYKCLYARLIPTDVTGTLDIRDASEFTDDELAKIVARAGGAGDAVQEASQEVSGSVH